MPSEKPLAKRRQAAAQRVREARERLTSTTGTRVAFDYELLRQFAENRLSASLVVLLLVGTVGFLSSLWTGAVVAGAWTAAVLVIHAVIVTKCRQFLSEPSTTQDLRRWRLRFIILDLFYGLAWMYNLIHPVGQDEGSSTFMLFVMLLVVAVASMLASSLPIAVFAATVPVTFAVALNFALQGDLHNYILGIMAIAAQGYFTLLAHRLYSAGLATLVARAEKDALIGELEQAKVDLRRGAAARRRRQHRQVAVPGADEPRAAHAAQRHPRLLRGDEDRGVRPAHGAGLQGILQRHPQFRPAPAQPHQRDPRSVAHRGRPLRAQRGGGVADRRGRGLPPPAEAAGQEPRHHHPRDVRAGPAAALGRRARAAAGLLNLLSNAIKFTPSGGEIWLKVGWTARAASI